MLCAATTTMATVTIDGKEIEIDDAERLNGIEAAARAGVKIPHYCWHPGLSVVASCRMCLVESGRKNADTGEVSMIPKLVPACQTPASDGTVFVTDSEKVRSARATVEEDLLLRHPVDCPICDKAGECSLQDYHFQYGRGERRADIDPYTSRRRPMGETVTLFVDRCVMCTRCVRFTREVSGTNELMVINRGAHEEIDVFPGFPLDNKMSGNVVDLCPVGALGDVDFLYSQRVWFMKRHAGVCAGCATGCSIDIEENQERVYRIKPRPNPNINQWWMCDDGRYQFRYIHDPERMTSPRISDGGEGRSDSAREVRQVGWDEALVAVANELSSGRRIVAVLSPFLTVEEAYLQGQIAREHDSDALLVVGPVPVSGEETTFANGFTISPEKAPNRRGVEAVVSLLQGEVIQWGDWGDRLSDDAVWWLTGGYPDRWPIGDGPPSNIARLIVHDLFDSPWSDRADIVLPSAAWVERAGSFVNRHDWLQRFDWAIRPPQGVVTEGRLFWQLAGREKLYQPDQVLRELANQSNYFAAAADGVPDTGLELRIPQLATT